MEGAVFPDHRERVKAACRSLDGLSVGDAFGERFFGPPEEVLTRISGRQFPGGQLRYTDDTVMALSIVEVLAETGGIDRNLLARRFAEKFAQDPTRGYGGTAFKILDAIARGRPWLTVSSSAFGGIGSKGNGAAMRAAPIGAYFRGAMDQAVEHARRSAEVTHTHPEGRAGAIAVAAAACHLAGGGTPGALLETVLASVPEGETRRGIREALRLGAGVTVEQAAQRLGTGRRVLSEDTVPFCLWCAARFGEDFQEALWHTVSGLGDRDTTCAIVGGVIACSEKVTVPSAWLSAREPLTTFRPRGR